MSEQKAMQPQGMPLRGAAGGEEQVPLSGSLCHGCRAPRVASRRRRTAPRASHPRLLEPLRLTLPPAGTNIFPCPRDGQPMPLARLLLTACRASREPQ